MPHGMSYYGPSEPLPHKASHQDGGADEITVQALLGLLTQEQLSSWLQVSGKPSTFPPSGHKTSHQAGGADEITVQALLGLLTQEQLSSWTQVSGKPSTFPPSGHKTSHQSAGSDELNLTGLTGKINLIDRGDPNAWDWETASFIKDGAFHDLNCSSIVPAGATWILFKGLFLHTLSNKLFVLKKKSKTNNFNNFALQTIAGTNLYVFPIVPCDADRIISYYFASDITWTTANLLIIGWIT